MDNTTDNNPTPPQAQTPSTEAVQTSPTVDQTTTHAPATPQLTTPPTPVNPPQSTQPSDQPLSTQPEPTPVAPPPPAAPVTPPATPTEEGKPHHGRGPLLIALGVLLFALVVVVGFVVYQRALNPPFDASVYPTAAPIPTPTITPTPGVSSDTSDATLEKEVEQTTVNDYSKDVQSIDKDVDSL